MHDAAARHGSRSLQGIAYAAAAYLAWGLFPLYFHALGSVPPLEILAHRIVWSALFVGLLATALGRWGAIAAALRQKGALLALAASATAISLNWLIYIWAVNNGHVLDASLGYFVNPLVTVLLGVTFLRDRLTRGQVAALALAGAGVAVMVVRARAVPWVALGLALSFGLYGLIRKRVQVDAISGLFAEVALLTPFAVAFLAWRASAGALQFGRSAGLSWLLASAGVVTAVPLLWFAAGVRRLRLSTVGLLQYLNPTLQFFIGVFAFGEPFTSAHAVAFPCIWASLAIYTAEAVAATRRTERAIARGVRA